MTSEMGDMWREVKEDQARCRAERMLMFKSMEQQFLDRGFTKRSEYHWTKQIANDTVQYWPSTGRFQYKRKSKSGGPRSLFKFLDRLEKKL